MVILSLKDFINKNNAIEYDSIEYEISTESNFNILIANGLITDNIDNTFTVNLNQYDMFTIYDVYRLYIRIRLLHTSNNILTKSKWFLKEPQPDKISIRKERNVWYGDNIIGRVIIDGENSKEIW